MTWATLGAVRSSTQCEFSARWMRYHFVRLSSGRWTRTIGPPDHATHVSGQIWRIGLSGER